MGVMCVLMGLLAEMLMRTFYESQGKSVYRIRATRNIEAKAMPAPQHVQPTAPVTVLLPMRDR